MTEYYDPESYSSEWNYLQSGTIIDKFIIERGLAHGGFSSVYLARQTEDQVQVAIKEYLPRKLAHRTWNNGVVAHNKQTKARFLKGRELFFEEAKALAKIKHPNIVNVINFFQENSTSYMVMDYDYGLTLAKLLQKKLVNVTDEFLIDVFIALLNGVRVIHDNEMIHLDIKPANILIRPGNDPLLLDFGAVKSFPLKSKEKRGKILTKGFSPLEQYSRDGNIGPWSDIYAIGASMRACMDGKLPPPAPDREKKDTLVAAAKAHKKRFSQCILKVVDQAMSIHPEDRPQTVEEFQTALTA